MPRREHSAQIISDGAYMLVYGGKNDGAFQLKNSKSLFNRDQVELTKACLDDLMLYNFKTNEWTAIA